MHRWATALSKQATPLHIPVAQRQPSASGRREQVNVRLISRHLLQECTNMLPGAPGICVLHSSGCVWYRSTAVPVQALEALSRLYTSGTLPFNSAVLHTSSAADIKRAITDLLHCSVRIGESLLPA